MANEFYKSLTGDKIIEWCEAHNELDWLEEIYSSTVVRKVYPTKIDANGNEVPDKTQEPTEIEEPISFIEVKLAFVRKFFPEEAPKKSAKSTMSFGDKIKAAKKRANPGE